MGDTRTIFPSTCPRVRSGRKKWRNCKMTLSFNDLDVQGKDSVFCCSQSVLLEALAILDDQSYCLLGGTTFLLRSFPYRKARDVAFRITNVTHFPKEIHFEALFRKDNYW
jgi:hypothetical protein